MNGGLLDEVIWTANTEKVNDLAYLDDLVASSPHYRKHAATKQYEWWLGAWEAVDDPSAVYLKIDDDVVSRLIDAGGMRVDSRNPYWERWGVTIADPDGYRLVLSSRSWP